MSRQPGRLKKTAIAVGVGAAMLIDLLGNGLTGGSFDESISSRAGRMARNGSLIAKGLCAALSTIDADHCNKAADNKGGG